MLLIADQSQQYASLIPFGKGSIADTSILDNQIYSDPYDVAKPGSFLESFQRLLNEQSQGSMTGRVPYDSTGAGETDSQSRQRQGHAAESSGTSEGAQKRPMDGMRDELKPVSSGPSEKAGKDSIGETEVTGDRPEVENNGPTKTTKTPGDGAQKNNLENLRKSKSGDPVGSTDLSGTLSLGSHRKSVKTFLRISGEERPATPRSRGREAEVSRKVEAAKKSTASQRIDIIDNRRVQQRAQQIPQQDSQRLAQPGTSLPMSPHGQRLTQQDSQTRSKRQTQRSSLGTLPRANGPALTVNERNALRLEMQQSEKVTGQYNKAQANLRVGGAAEKQQHGTDSLPKTHGNRTSKGGTGRNALGESAAAEAGKAAIGEQAGLAEVGSVGESSESLSGVENGEVRTVEIFLTKTHRGTQEIAQPFGMQSPFASETRELIDSQIVRQTGIILKNNNRGEIRLVLKPEHLGRLRVRIQLDDNRLTGRIFVDNATVKDSLDNDLESLYRAFRENGFEAEGFEVLVDRRDSRQSSGRDAEQDSSAKTLKHLQDAVPILEEINQTSDLINLVI
ncbi:MAG: hypothetical protein CMN78_04890 [Spirochaetales bacterium]|nr:hypothetical protein [Spirochaetales bacterium]